MDDSLNETQFNTIGALTKGAAYGGLTAMMGAGVPMSLLSAVTASGILKEYGKPQTGSNTVAAINQFARNNSNPTKESNSIIDYTANFSDVVNILKGLNKTFMTVVNRIENTNALLEKVIGIQTGEEPININATIKRNNRLALQMSRSALGRMTLSLMSRAIGASGPEMRAQNLMNKAIESGSVHEGMYLRAGIMNELGKKFDSLKKLTESFGQTIEYFNNEVLQQKAIFTEETNISITQIIPLRLTTIGNIIQKSTDKIGEYFNDISETFENWLQLDVEYKRDTIDYIDNIHGLIYNIDNMVPNLYQLQDDFFKQSISFYNDNLKILGDISTRLHYQKDDSYFPVKIIKNNINGSLRYNNNFSKKLSSYSFSDYDNLESGSRFKSLLENFVYEVKIKDKKNNKTATEWRYALTKANREEKNLLELKKNNKLDAYTKEKKKEEDAQNELLKSLNITASQIYGQQVKFGSFMQKYITNIPNIITRILNTALKLFLTFNLTKIIYKGIRWAFGISENIKDGIIGFFNKLVDSNSKQLTAGGINLYDRIMKFIFGEKYKDHKDMANNIKENGILKTIGLFLVDQIKEGFKWLWESGTIVSVLKYYILFQGAKQLLGMMPGMIYGLVSLINKGIISIGSSMAAWATPARLLSIKGIASTLFGGGILLFGTKLFNVLAGVLPFLFKHAKIITFFGFLFKHMFDNWFASLDKNIQEQFSQLNLIEKITYTIKYMFFNFYVWFSKTEAFKVLDEYMGHGFGNFMSKMWDLISGWFAEHWKEILFFSIASTAGTALSGHPVIGGLLGLGGVWGVNEFFGDGSITKWLEENFKFTDKYKKIDEYSQREENLAKLREGSKFKNLIFRVSKVADTLVEIKKTGKELLESTNNIKDSVSTAWKTFKKTFIDIVKPTSLGSILGGFKNFFNNIGNAIAPDYFKEYFKSESEKGNKTIEDLLKAANLQEKYKNKFVNGALIHSDTLNEFIQDVQNNRSNENVSSILKNAFNIEDTDSVNMLSYQLAKFNSVQTNYNATEIAKQLAKEEAQRQNKNTADIVEAAKSAGAEITKASKETTVAVKKTTDPKTGFWSIFGTTPDEASKKIFSPIIKRDGGFIDTLRESFTSNGLLMNWMNVLHGTGTNDKNAFLVHIDNDEYNDVIDNFNKNFDIITQNKTKEMVKDFSFDQNRAQSSNDSKRAFLFNDTRLNKVYHQKFTSHDWHDMLKNTSNSSISNLMGDPTYIITSDDYYRLAYKYARSNNDKDKEKLNFIHNLRDNTIRGIVDTSIGSALDFNYGKNYNEYNDRYKNLSYNIFNNLKNSDLAFLNNKNLDIDQIKNNFLYLLQKNKATLSKLFTDDEISPESTLINKATSIIIPNMHRSDVSRSQNNSNIFDLIYIPLINSLTKEDIIPNEDTKPEDIFNNLLKPIIALSELINISRDAFLFHMRNQLNISSSNDYLKLYNRIKQASKYDNLNILKGVSYPEDFFGYMFINSIHDKINFKDLYNLLLNPNNYTQFENLFSHIGLNYGNGLKSIFKLNVGNVYNTADDVDQLSAEQFISYIGNITGLKSNITGYENLIETMYNNINIKLLKDQAKDPNGLYRYNNYLQFTPNLGDYNHFNKLNPTLKNKMINYGKDFYQKYGKKVVITSGYRSLSEQQELYNKMMRGEISGPIAAPNPSNNIHNMGLAVDISHDYPYSSIDKGLLAKNGLMQPDQYNDPYHIEAVEWGKLSPYNKIIKYPKNNSLLNEIGDPDNNTLNNNLMKSIINQDIRSIYNKKYGSFLDETGFNNEYRIVIDKDNHILYLYSGYDKVKKEYKITTGKNLGQKQQEGDQRTPEGSFKIIQLQDSSSWKYDYKDGNGEVNAYGPWFMRLETPLQNGQKYIDKNGKTIKNKTAWTGIGIHGTSRNDMIGKNDSNGCIRLLNNDIIELKNILFGENTLGNDKFKGYAYPVYIMPNKISQSKKPENKLSTQSWKDFYKNGYISFKGEKDWYKYIVEAGLETGIDPALLAALIYQESTGDPAAVSEKGAKGLTQLFPSAINDVHHFYSNTSKYTDPFNPKHAIYLGAYYLKALNERYKLNNVIDMLRGYNWGPANVKHFKKHGSVISGYENKIDKTYAEKILSHYKNRYFVHPDSPLDPNIANTIMNTNGSSDSIIDQIIKNNGEKLSKEESEKYIRWWTFIKNQLQAYGYDTSSWDLINQTLLNNKDNIQYTAGTGDKDHFLKINPVLRKRVLDYGKDFYKEHKFYPWLTSSYRTQAEQDALQSNYTKASKSLHTLGMAVDFAWEDINTRSLDDELLAKHNLYRPYIEKDPVHVEPIETKELRSKYNSIYDKYGGFPEMLKNDIFDSNIYNLSSSSSSSNNKSWLDPLHGFFDESSNILQFYIELLTKAMENNKNNPSNHSSSSYYTNKRIFSTNTPLYKNPDYGLFPEPEKRYSSLREEAGDPVYFPSFNDTTRHFNSMNNLYEVGDPVFNKSPIINFLEKGVNKLQKRVVGKFKNAQSFAGVADDIFQNELELLNLSSKQSALQFKNVHEERIQNLEDKFDKLITLFEKKAKDDETMLKGFANTMATTMSNTMSSVGNIVNNTITNLSTNTMNASNSVSGGQQAISSMSNELMNMANNLDAHMVLMG